MMKCRSVLLLLISVFLFAGIVCAQDEDERKWALSYTGGVLVKPVLTSNPMDVSPGRGSGFNLMGELYLKNKWHLQAGYFRTDLSYGGGERTMEGLQAGMKKYFLHPECFIQPYLLGAGQINWSRHTEYATYSSRKQQTVNPRISFLPGVGFDLYLFSSVAFVMEYSFNMGLNSHTNVEAISSGGTVYTMADKGMFHNLALGVRLTFPFTVTNNDGQMLLGMLWEALFGSLERTYQEKQWR